MQAGKQVLLLLPEPIVKKNPKKNPKRNTQSKGKGKANPKLLTYSPLPLFNLEEDQKMYVPQDEIEMSFPDAKLDVVTNPPERVKMYDEEKAADVNDAVLYDAFGRPTIVHPTFHKKSDAQNFYGLLKAVESCYVNGKPRHAQKGVYSNFLIMDEKEYKELEPEAVQDLVRYRQLVLTDCEMSSIEFTPRSLSNICSLTSALCIHDHSVVSKNPNDCHHTGNLQQILDCIDQGDKGKILNVLDIPNSTCPLPTTGYSSELIAWNATGADLFCHRQTEHYPYSDMSWYLIGLSGALHLGHIDSDGQGTVIEVRNREGAKFWMKATRKELLKKNDDPEVDRAAALLELANINMFLQFSLEVPNLDHWILEGILLTHKTRLVMGPDCPHWVYTPFHTICSGGHYIASSTIQDTMIGLIHAFMLDNFVSNTNHTPTRILLCRLASLYYEGFVKQRYSKHEIAHAHLFDFENFCSVVDLMSFCNLIIFINVLDFKTYMYNTYITVNNVKELSEERLAAIEAFDFNAVHPKDRLWYQHARGQAYALIDWLFKSVDIIDKKTNRTVKDPHTSLWVPYIAQQASALLLYRKKADKAKFKGAPGSTAATLNRQILLCFEGIFLEDPVNAAIESEHEVFTFLEPLRYDVTRLTGLKAPLLGREPFDWGETAADKKFHSGNIKGWALSSEDIEEAYLTARDMEPEEEEPVKAVVQEEEEEEEEPEVAVRPSKHRRTKVIPSPPASPSVSSEV
ncbi:hypothetical protein GALMADRAFT_146664 [Galerina marginata CBS 339.88]|uniref:Uncharacterized protein n=1 Tax=Galerina marginata (strain CBS 339.88) TaxID=685588 RepID=A0A067SD67_GALM3|nr:hypothetical protein GALMADRAFT_146664 [Galerina marginata CBS 339.88]